MTEIDIDVVINRVLKRAKEVRDIAGYGGRMDDGGASILETQARFYGLGRGKLFPPEWNSFKEEAKVEADPEYAEYKRLKRKFEK